MKDKILARIQQLDQGIQQQMAMAQQAHNYHMQLEGAKQEQLMLLKQYDDEQAALKAAQTPAPEAETAS